MKSIAHARIRRLLPLLGALALLASGPVHALELTWSGQFRAEANRISNYSLDSSQIGATRDPVREAADGYYTPGGGLKTAQFQDLFMRLMPSAIVNDNVALRSELWLGNPITGFYGDGYPGADRPDQREYNSTFTRGSAVTAQRFWADFLTDFGMFQVGRAPMNWGLGLVHSAGNGLWDRYQSTGDVIRMSSKFGNFTVLPSFAKFSYGNAVGGAAPTCGGGGVCGNQLGGSGISEYSLGMKYESAEEELTAGLNFVRRIGGSLSEGAFLNAPVGVAGQSQGSTVGGQGITIWDIFVQKRVGKFEFKAEAPLFSGKVQGSSAGREYKAYAIAVETLYHFTDSWSLNAKAGRVPGQPNSDTADTSKWRMVYLHPNYRLGMFLFNYQLRNFAGPNNPDSGSDQTRSIYDNPVTNASYLNVGTAYKTDKWTFHLDWFAAKADESAESGKYFFNTWDRRYVLANGNQSKNLGMEIDWGANFDWDEFTSFGLDFGYFMPGNYYAFSNVAPGAGQSSNATDNVFGIQAKVGIRF